MAWVGCVLLLAACTRDNGAYEGGGAGASSTAADDDPKADAADDPVPATTVGSGGAEGGTRGGTTTITTGDDAAETTLSMEGPDPTTGSNEEGPSTETTDGPTTGDVPPEACCLPAAPCGNEAVSACACKADPECCAASWGLYCVALAISQECLECGPPPPHDCCETNLMPGCSDFGVMACVCSEHPECCEGQWGALCVDAASMCPESPCG